MNEMNQKIYRTEYNKVIAGVASGIAESYQIDVTIVRLLFVLSTVFLAGLGIVIYGVIWVVAPVHRFPKTGSFQTPPFQKFNQPVDGKVNTSSSPFQTFNSNTMNPQGNPVFIPKNNFNYRKKSSAKLIFGVILIVIGLNLLFDSFHLFNVFDYFDKWWPLVLIGVGVFLLLKYKERNQEMENFMSGMPPFGSAPETEKPAETVSTASSETTNNEETTNTPQA